MWPGPLKLSTTGFRLLHGHVVVGRSYDRGRRRKQLVEVESHRDLAGGQSSLLEDSDLAQDRS